MKKSNLIASGIIILLILATAVIFGCGKAVKPVSPAIARVDAFFTALTNNQSKEALRDFISDSCVPSRETVIDFGQDAIVFKPNACNYSIVSSSINDETATIEVVESLIATTELYYEMIGIGPISYIQIYYPSKTMVLSNEAGTWRFISYPKSINMAMTISGMLGTSFEVMCLTQCPDGTGGTNPNTNLAHSPDVISTTTSTLSPWAFLWTSLWTTSFSTWENTDYSIRLTVYSTSDAPYNSYTFTHSFTIPVR